MFVEKLVVPSLLLKLVEQVNIGVFTSLSQ